MDTAFMTYKEVVDEYKLQITKKDARIRELEDAVKRIDKIKRTAEKGWRDMLIKNDRFYRALEVLKKEADSQYNRNKSSFAKLVSIRITEALKEGEDEQAVTEPDSD